MWPPLQDPPLQDIHSVLEEHQNRTRRKNTKRQSKVNSTKKAHPTGFSVSLSGLFLERARGVCEFT